jgi:hypothetical protein
MAQQSQPMKEFLQIIDDKTMKAVMEYFKFQDYDVIMQYLGKLGIREK